MENGRVEERKAEMNTDLMKRSLEVAIAEIGVREIPENSNRGPDVEKYGKSVKLPPGNPYCMAFVYWCVGEAAKALSMPNPLPVTAYTPTLWAWALGDRAARVWSGEEEFVPPGSLFLLRGKVSGEEKERVKHIGFCERLDGQRILTTVEGNTDLRGDREGGGVYRLTRPLVSIFKVILY